MKDEFSLGKYPHSSLLVVYSDRDEILLDPDYQRLGGIWTHEKRQLLLDSLLNGFDVPKLYFHEFVPPQGTVGNMRYRYAIIDGKQRLQTIWAFIDGKISLANDFKYLRDDSVDAAGLDYSNLAKKHPRVKQRFDATPLDIVTIRTSDIELIEDMFSRLNEAVPLNAPEKRNALGGPLPEAIRRVGRHDFFARKIPFSDRRYRHRDLAAKFLYLEFVGQIANTKKATLDDFVRKFKRWRARGSPRATGEQIERLVGNCEATLGLMSGEFGVDDRLLRQVGMVTLYYHLFRNVRLGAVSRVSRPMLIAFEEARKANRYLVEEKGEANNRIDTGLVEFDQHAQTPNDAYAIRIRLQILLGHLEKNAGVSVERRSVSFGDGSG